MDKRHSAGYAILALLLGFIGIFSFSGDLLAGEVASRDVSEAMVVEDSVTTRKVQLSPIEEALLHPRRLRPHKLDMETLWLARCIYAETKRPEEQELVAWVIRNRVETGYRGKRTYQSVILDPYQFSAFNPTSSSRFFFSHLNERSNPAGWAAALRIAYMVRTSDATSRPFSIRTRHFFSERSMIDRSTPYWVEDHEPVDVREPVDEERFRFYAGVA